MRRAASGSGREPTITLINIVFLMLIFFLVAGTLATPLDTELQLVRTSEMETAPPADVLVIHADGRMARQGTSIGTEAEFIALLPAEARQTVRILPDRDLPATTMVSIGRALRQAGAEKIVIVSERGLE